jgi:arsenate reductase
VDLTLWHNPRCSKSRAALALLQDRGVSFDVRLYLKDAPDADEVRALAHRIGRPVGDIVRRSEAAYRELNLKEADDETLARAVADNPILLERPILDTGRHAVIGRPPETILTLI